MKGINKDVWILAALLVMLIAAGVLTQSNRQEQDSKLFPRGTSYSAAPSGSKALYDTLGALGYRVRRNLDAFDPSLPSGSLLLVSPERSVSAEEWTALRDWIRKGNQLIIAGLGLIPVQLRPHEHARPAYACCPSFFCSTVHTLRVAGIDRIDADNLRLDENGLYDAFGYYDEDESSKGGAPLIPLFADHEGTVAACCNCGKGQVILLSSGSVMSNQGIKRGDNLAFVLDALDHLDPGRKLEVTFDEYHHGYGEQKGILSLINTPARLGLAEIAVAFLLLVFSASRRFGRTIPLSEGSRERGEYLSSMASLLKNAHAAGLARSQLGKRFLADVAHASGIDPSAGVDAIVAAAQARYPTKSAQLAELCRAAVSNENDSNEAAVFALVRRWHKIREELKK